MIRDTDPGDREQIMALYPQAFPDEELRPVVGDLLDQQSGVLSLAAFKNETLVAHVIFAECSTGGDRGGALLGPLAVLPAFQRGGLGTAVVEAGFVRLTDMDVTQVFVLGDPGYYSRFGFTCERRVRAPYALPEKWTEAWQSRLIENREALDAGKLILPAPWMQPELWGA